MLQSRPLSHSMVPTAVSGAGRRWVVDRVLAETDTGTFEPAASASRRMAAEKWTDESIKNPPGHKDVSRRHALEKYLKDVFSSAGDLLSTFHTMSTDQMILFLAHCNLISFWGYDKQVGNYPIWAQE